MRSVLRRGFPLALVVATWGVAITVGTNGIGTTDGAFAHFRAPAPACFGAAARDPQRPCSKARVSLSVVPTPSQAPTLPNAPCAAIVQEQGLQVCEFGVPAATATATFALVGDSHAGGWRAAAQKVADALGWHGISITHTSCPLSTAVRNLPDPARFAQCAQWKSQVFAWFGAHPEVSVVFVAGLSGGRGVVPSLGRNEFETAVGGYIDAWNALPATVKHIVVIHDTPKVLAGTAACVERAIATRRPPGLTCAVSRRTALDPDSLVVAADRLRSPRVQVVDLRNLFCDRTRCYPVIGGALVFRDVTHMTATFAATLGPYLLGDVERLMRAWK
jgi:hypothetical protein